MSRELFRKFSQRSAAAVGSPVAFVFAIFTMFLWLITGPIFHFSDTWQLVINTLTNIITFLMVFLIQNAQNRDAKALHLKLDEVIRGVKGARTEMVNLEELSDQELEKLHREFKELHDKTAHKLNLRKQKNEIK